MATGSEMAMKAALNMAFKMFGIDSTSIQQDVVTAAYAVLTFDVRLADIERNQRVIMTALGIPQNLENISDAENRTEQSDTANRSANSAVVSRAG